MGEGIDQINKYIKDKQVSHCQRRDLQIEKRGNQNEPCSIRMELEVWCDIIGFQYV